MKKNLILLPLLLSVLPLGVNAADKEVKAADKKTSFADNLSFRTFYSVIAEDNFNFENGAAGLEVLLGLNKNLGLSFEAIGVDDTTGTFVDRVGVNFIARLPLNKSKVSLYAQGGFGYHTKSENTDMILRGGVEYRLSNHFSVFSDVGNGVRLQDGNNYQQVRGGVSFNF